MFRCSYLFLGTTFTVASQDAPAAREMGSHSTLSTSKNWSSRNFDQLLSTWDPCSQVLLESKSKHPEVQLCGTNEALVAHLWQANMVLLLLHWWRGRLGIGTTSFWPGRHSRASSKESNLPTPILSRAMLVSGRVVRCREKKSRSKYCHRWCPALSSP